MSVTTRISVQWLPRCSAGERYFMQHRRHFLSSRISCFGYQYFPRLLRHGCFNTSDSATFHTDHAEAPNMIHATRLMTKAVIGAFPARESTKRAFGW
jgi:hypothetical protein